MLNAVLLRSVADPSPEGASQWVQERSRQVRRASRKRGLGGWVAWVVVEVEGAEIGGSKAGGGVWLKHDDTRIQLSLFRNVS